VVSPLGQSVEALMSSLMAGDSAVVTLNLARGASGSGAQIGAPVAFDADAHFPAPRLRMLDRVSQMALVAANQAIAAAMIDFSAEVPARCGVSVGTAMGGADSTEDGYYNLFAQRSDRVKPFSVLASMTNAAASWIGIEHGLRGPNLTYSTACSSSTVALGEAARRIQHGDVDIMIAGGSEAPLTLGVMRAWEALRTLAAPDPVDIAASCRPFSASRSGLVLGEGAAFVVLEEWNHAEARGAPILAELSGYGLASDCVHITRPTVQGQADAMRAAIASATLEPGVVDYVNAHGTGTAQNDAVETAALKEVFGKRAYSLPISSSKSMHGHLLGAAGALEFVIAVGCLVNSTVVPTMHLDRADPECDLDYVPGAGRRDVALRAVMSNSFAFGGTNAVLIATGARA
jgi:3-oxoacyl-[acyl-carrier-protein] synthase II